MLKIKNLSAIYDNQEVIDNVSFEVKSENFYLILGDVNSGGNALMQFLAGNDAIEPSSGSVTFNNHPYDQLSIEKRNHMGIFTISVNTPQIDGVDHYNFCKKIFKIHHPTSSDRNFETFLREYYELLNLSHKHDDQIVNNAESSAFDHIKNELLLMMLSSPKLVIVEDIDATLNVEQQGFIANTLKMYIKNQKRACLIFTQDQNFANMLPVTHVSLMSSGSIVKKGSKNLLKRNINDEYS